MVDASASVQQISSTLLRIAGFTVESFGDPGAAVQRSIDLRPDVMVVEPRSPGIDVLAMMRVLRELHGDRAQVVVWCTTVVPEPAQVEEGSRLGLRGVVIKPFRLEALTSLVLRVCRDEERDRRLRELGVPDLQLAARTLDAGATRLWAQAEAEAGSRAPRPLSIVRVSGAGSRRRRRGPRRPALHRHGRLRPGRQPRRPPPRRRRLRRRRRRPSRPGGRRGRGRAQVVPVTLGPEEAPIELLERTLPGVTPAGG